MRNRDGGFTLFELLITLAVMGIVAALAVPAYRSYIDTANMTKVSAHFEEAIRLARNTYNKDKTRLAIGLPATAPTTTQGWIALFDRNNVTAPGGGPAYSTNKKGDPETGAIGVEYKPAKPPKDGKAGKGPELKLRRPAYLTLVEQEAKIKVDSVEVKNK